ncbi:MAG: alpha-E domain-containing protein [Gammaproteobacteria bacterium]|nr:alpha-E domain-containing protein [Gammaproteobacteria bacterium]
MLSRVAERIYWQARYLERAENTARLLSVFSTLLLDLPPNTKLSWRSLVEITGTDQSFEEKYKQATERNVMRFLLLDSASSLLNTLENTRENARTTREIMPLEAFEKINDLFHYAKDHAADSISGASRHKFLEEIISSCHEISGLMAGSMSRGAAYSFVRLGRSLERADMATRIVDVGSGNLLTDIGSGAKPAESSEPYENTLWMNILRSLTAYQMYRQHVKHRVNGEDVVRFLLQDDDFPRAATHVLTTITKVLKHLPNNAKAAKQVDKTLRIIEKGNIDKLLDAGLFEYLDVLQIEIAKIHTSIADTWFLPHK